MRRLRIHRDLETEELLALIDALAENAESQAAAGGLEQTLIRAGVRHITTSEVEFARHFERVREEADREQAESCEDPGGAGEDAAGSPQIQITHEQETVEAEERQETSDPVQEEATRSLLWMLTELENAEELDTYQRHSDRIHAHVATMLQDKRAADAYRSVLVYCRHAEDTDGRSTAIRQEAMRRLTTLVGHPELLDLLTDYASSEQVDVGVQATQVLICLGAEVVPDLLERAEQRGTLVQGRLSAVMITLGDTALPAIAEQLDSADPGCARRAARLLGRTQNPGAVDLLREKLWQPDHELQTEAARALARIGTEPAVKALLEGSRRAPEIAEVVAACLGDTGSEMAVKTLARMVDPSHKHSLGEQREAIRSLGRIRSPSALEPLRRVLERRRFFGRRRNRVLRVAAAQAIGRIGGPQASQLLTMHTHKGDAALQQVCRESLERMDPTS